MQTGRNRHERKDHSGRVRANRGRGGRRLRWAALGAAVLSLALPSVSAQAITGGAGVHSAEGAVTDTGGLVFSSPMRMAGATWYGPGLYGNSTACGRSNAPSGRHPSRICTFGPRQTDGSSAAVRTRSGLPLRLVRDDV